MNHRTASPPRQVGLPPIRILLVDSAPLTRYALSTLLAFHPDFLLVSAVASVGAVPTQIDADLAFIHAADWSTPPCLSIPILTFTVSDEPARIIAAARARLGRRPDRASGTPIALTRREQEVLSLLAHGATDHEIGAALHVSVRTVRSHLDRIRSKTGQRRRADLTRWHLERGCAPV